MLLMTRFASPHTIYASAMSTTSADKKASGSNEVVGPLVAVAQLTATSDHAQNYADAAACAQEVGLSSSKC